MTQPEYENFLENYPAPAILVDAEGNVLSANTKGAGLKAILSHQAAPEINALIHRSASQGMLLADTVSLQSSKGEVILEISVLPLKAEDKLLVLTRDMTMERNLRSALVESRQRYKDLVEVSSDFCWEVDENGVFTFVSQRGTLGYSSEELIGLAAEQLVVNPESFPNMPFTGNKALENVEVWLKRKDGSTACMVMASVPLTVAVGTENVWKGARGVCRDVTMERESEAALANARHREQLLHYIVSTIRDELEPANMLDAATAATARALGVAGCRIFRQITPGEFTIAAEYGNIEGVDDLDPELKSLQGGGDVKKIELGDWQILAAATSYRKSVNGALTIWKSKTEPSWDDDHVLMIADVANQLGIANEQITNHERIVALSRTDSLTGMLNRRAFFEEELPRRVSRLQLSRKTAALFYIDMDNFKLVNDIHGHKTGDDAILFLRDMLMEFSRPGDVIARLGGDEFAMWLDDISEEVTLKRAKTLIDASKKLEKFSGSPDKQLGISVGVAIYDPRDNETLNGLVTRADEAMYSIKKDSKGGFAMAPAAALDNV